MYNPISCEFFDQLEVAIQRNIPSTVVYYNDNNEMTTIKGLVETLMVIEGREYMLLDNQLQIRLDKVISFNGKKYIELY